METSTETTTEMETSTEAAMATGTETARQPDPAAPVTFGDRIAAEVGSWPGVVVDDGELGELAFKVGRREIGHLHGDHMAHFGFPKATWRALHDAGRIEGHPVFPGRVGPASRRIDDDADVADVIELFRLGYERVLARRATA